MEQKTKQGKPKKGTYGYIAYSKKKCIIHLLLCMFSAFFIFLLGYFLNKKSTENIFSVFAMLFVLPGAKIVVSYIVFFPYHTVKKTEYQQVVIACHKEAILLTDFVFTSPEKIMGVSYCVINSGSIVFYIDRKKENIAYIEQYIKKGVYNQGYDYSLEIYINYNKFMKRIKGMQYNVEKAQDDEKVQNYFLTLGV